MLGSPDHRTREAEAKDYEGLPRPLPPSVTRFITGRDAVLDELRRAYLTSKELAVCTVFSGLVEGRNRLGEVYLELAERFRKGKHKGIRCLTSIDSEEETYLLQTLLGLGFQMRHTENFPSLSFSLVEDETGNASVMIGLWHNLVVSGEAQFVKHFRSLFEELWADGEEAIRRVEEIQSGVEPTSIEIIGNADESIKRIENLITDAIHELLVMTTPSEFRRYQRAGVFGAIDQALERKRDGMVARVLIPSSKAEFSSLLESTGMRSSVEFRRIDQNLIMGFTMLMIDRKHSFILETKDDTRVDLHHSLGFTTYAESRTIASSYATIFETLWKQAEMFDTLEAHERMQSEFINIAAHELRSPVQAIMTAAELVEGEGEFARIVSRNARRLQRLIQDLLDVQRIERNELRMTPERFALDELLREVVNDYELNLRKKGLKILLEEPERQTIVSLDKERITQVLTNLLDNAIEFIEEGGAIAVRLERAPGQTGEVVISITDTGKGIHPAVISVLFSKFVSKSKSGTGLGLYIAKGIVEAHGGRIWGRNNEGGRGATFGFSLPTGDP